MHVVEKTIETPQWQIIEKIVEFPEMQAIQCTQTFESSGTAPVRQVAPVEIVEVAELVPPFSAESAPPVFVTAPVVEAAPVDVQPAHVVKYVTLAPAVTCVAPAPVAEHAAPATAVTFAAPASVIKLATPDIIDPTPAVSCAAPVPEFEPTPAATKKRRRGKVAPKTGEPAAACAAELATASDSIAPETVDVKKWTHGIILVTARNGNGCFETTSEVRVCTLKQGHFADCKWSTRNEGGEVFLMLFTRCSLRQANSLVRILDSLVKTLFQRVFIPSLARCS